MSDDDNSEVEGRDFVFYKSAQHADPERKEKAWMLLAEGKTLAAVSEETGYHRGTLSKWRRSVGFAKWHADHGGTPYVPLVKKGRPGPKPRKKDPLRIAEVRGRFLQAVQVGGIHWAQQFAEATDREAAMFMRELAVGNAAAKPRIKVLAELLAIGLDKQVLEHTRIKALVEWWKLVENALGQAPLIHIDARQENEKPTPTQHLLAAIQDQLATATGIDLMTDGEIIEAEEAGSDTSA